MGKDVYENSLKAKEFLENASEICKIDFKHLLFEPNEDIDKSEFTQPAIVLNSLMIYLALCEKETNIEVKCMLGHSLGEFTALCVSEAFSFFDALNLVHKRGIFMQEDCVDIEAAMMVVLGLDDEKIQELCDQARSDGKSIFAANYNCKGQVVVAGLKNDLLSFEEKFKQAGAKKTMLLKMNVASHCPLLENSSKKLCIELEKVLNANFKPVVSNVSAKPYTSKEEALQLLRLQLISPVLYRQSIETIQDEVDCFVEFGANVLKGLNKKISSKPTYSLTQYNEIDEFLKVAK
ncbi:ACP S-malonyltransferase [Campylobacter sp. MIT 21-1685]|uniref:ACP S-malonyltransferase n=1 Tax=unclassified Campylobacter TaxID=2593542 RepID=UPI00224AE274|nr:MULTISPECIES: ACP S-malonyltransferase [unclassified Campylobacter]MCX2683324.1 ACP S-malonyltransferase [Campylobacter sp. MIT 21-1684]MCX2751621.1 ACP S-malonyltransferase [Campylobacter sp. MIT 21-1682]MCX2807820.1 ACP S-malonyltransferase [Campylobacter sp. MIT 21-1685]